MNLKAILGRVALQNRPTVTETRQTTLFLSGVLFLGFFHPENEIWLIVMEVRGRVIHRNAKNAECC
jgi:hypothetical protein